MMKEYFDKYGIEKPDNFTFSERNLIIGRNGSGKTRLLKAYRDYCQQNRQDFELIYVYFPMLSHKYDEKFEDVVVDNSLYDIVNEGEDMSYDEFVVAFQYTGVSLVESYIKRLGERGRIAKEKATDTINKIKCNLENFLGMKLIIGEREIAIKLSDGREKEIKEALSEMSPGELNLFYISLFLALTSNEKKYILMMDEPEMHVHPSVVLDFYKTLDKMSCMQEIWIATHSPLLLQEFSFDEIILVSHGKIQLRNSHLYENILSEMLGKNQKAVSELFRSIQEWEYCNFIAECFFSPTVVDKIDVKDEQVVKFMNCCESMSKKNLSILDWGAGTGRLGKCMKLIAQENKYSFRYCYEIYEPYFKNRGTNSEFQVFTSERELRKRYDCIVLMNVLHEIGINEWLQTFKSIARHLTPTGYLIFAEAKTLSIGEQPYCDNGYIVLGEAQVKELFKPSTGAEIMTIHIKFQKEEKSELHMIPVQLLKNLTDSDIQNALISLKKETFLKLKEMDKERIQCVRNGEQPSFTYRRYAFMAQQLVNVMLALSMRLEQNINITDESKEEKSRNNVPRNPHFIV